MSGDLAAIRERHYERTGQSFDTPKGVCAWDGTAWPCDAAQLLALLADTPSVEPLDVERLAEALKEYDAGRLRVPFAPSHVLSPDQSPSRFHRAWAKTLLDYALLPTQASDSPEPKETR